MDTYRILQQTIKLLCKPRKCKKDLEAHQSMVKKIGIVI